MDRIEGFGGMFNVPPKPGDKQRARKAGRKHKLFASILDEKVAPGSAGAGDLEDGQPPAGLEALLDAVHETGERLKSDVSMVLIRQYKQAVRNFIRTIVDSCYGLEEHAVLRKQKKYTLISVIDEKLERLAAAVLAGQRNQLDILRRVDEIYGFLVDLLR
jgi:uncharacterized protein